MSPSAERVVRFQDPLMFVHRLLEPTAGRAANGKFNQAKCAEIQRVFFLLLLLFVVLLLMLPRIWDHKRGFYGR